MSNLAIISISATVQCFDNGSPALSVRKKLSVEILDSNDAPTGILINGSGITKLKENSPVEAVVGHLTCVDQDARQSHVYSLQSSEGVFMVRKDRYLLIFFKFPIFSPFVGYSHFFIRN